MACMSKGGMGSRYYSKQWILPSLRARHQKEMIRWIRELVECESPGLASNLARFGLTFCVKTIAFRPTLRALRSHRHKRPGHHPATTFRNYPRSLAQLSKLNKRASR